LRFPEKRFGKAVAGGMYLPWKYPPNTRRASVPLRVNSQRASLWAAFILHGGQAVWGDGDLTPGLIFPPGGGFLAACLAGHFANAVFRAGGAAFSGMRLKQSGIRFSRARSKKRIPDC
jgi:hypothetical protein